MNEIIWYLSFSDWFISLSIMLSSPIHVIANGKISFFLMGEYFSIMYICHVFFILSSGNGYLGSFHNLAYIHTLIKQECKRHSINLTKHILWNPTINGLWYDVSVLKDLPLNPGTRKNAMLLSYGCSDIQIQTGQFKAMQTYFFTVWKSEIQNESHWAKLKVLAFWALRRQSVSLPFPASKGLPHS